MMRLVVSYSFVPLFDRGVQRNCYGEQWPEREVYTSKKFTLTLLFSSHLI